MTNEGAIQIVGDVGVVNNIVGNQHNQALAVGIQSGQSSKYTIQNTHHTLTISSTTGPQLKFFGLSYLPAIC